MGQPTPPGVDLVTRFLEAGDRYLFCTDGVTRLVSNAEISDIMKKSGAPAAAVNELVALALRRGGPDNATAVVIFIDSV
jgi:protein phosphatase